MFRTMNDFNFHGKRVLLRTDVNAPLINGKVKDCLRIKKSSETLRELSDKGAKVTVLAHQGRKHGNDYLEDMEQHANILSRHIGKKVKYVHDLMGEDAKKEIKNLKNEEILLLKNVRSLDEEVENKTPEEHSKGILVRTLSPFFDIFVNDAFSASHRSHESLVGFIPVLPSCAGRLMEKEYLNISRILKEPKHPAVIALGGNKPEDIIGVMKNLLGKGIADKILLGGVIGNFFIAVEKNLKINNTEKLKDASKILEEYKDKIYLPKDLALEENGKRVERDVDKLPNNKSFFDIGEKSIELYKKEISRSSTVIMKGPMGMFENDIFAKGTKEILKAISRSKGFTILGGGHTSSLPETFGIPLEKFSHVSVAGGAFIRLLSGEKLPVIEALKKYCN